MTLTLAGDHRILYGAEAARFLREVKAGLEEPAQ
jgi:pyruvate/2-oxoglutarate dehydrogenase complex dihydrolipoamide acyltransferase (E2) component